MAIQPQTTMEKLVRRFPLITCLAALVAAIVSPNLGAQSTAVHEGSRVRITTPAMKNATGVVQTAGPDTVVIFTEPFGAPVRVARYDISKIEVSHGRLALEGAKKGAIWGGIVGLTAGAIALLSVHGNETPAVDRNNGVSDGAFVAANVVGMVVTGAGIGALIKAERWSRVRF